MKIKNKDKVNFIRSILFYAAFILIMTALPFSLTLKQNQALSSDIKTDDLKIREPEILTFTRDDSVTCMSIIKSLERQHFSGLHLNDMMSSKILDRYLNMLDPGRNLFIQKDINEFERLRYNLDNTLERGRLHPGYTMFNIYLQRSFKRLGHIMELLETWETTFDFNENDDIVISDKTDPWPENFNDLPALWKKELKNDIIIMKLQGESDNEITSTLKKKYKSRMNRLLQTNPTDIFKTYMNAVTMSFDPHTQYFPPRISEDFDIQMSLSLEGIGAILQSEFEYTKVVRLIPAGPADKSSKLTPGDKIIGVGQGKDGEIQDTVGWRIDEVVNLIRGPKDTVVHLKIIPAEQKNAQKIRFVNITRDRVKLEEQAAHKEIVTINKKGKPFCIGIISIPAFYLDFKALQEGKEDYRSTTRDVLVLINELKQEKIDGLIIDLRDNGGGALQEVNQLTGAFITSGPTVQIKSRNGFMSQLDDPDPSVEYRGPIIVMINRMSASASEIFAGAIKDYNRGIIVGTQTFGKGTVQAMQPLHNGQLKLTSAKFYRISGKSTQNLGVIPDIEYPKIYNTEETGESSLQGALPWDTSRKAEYRPYKLLEPVIQELNKRHIVRTENDPDFGYLRERYQLAEEIYKQKSLSLNLLKRQQYKEELAQRELEIKNRLLIANGEKPLSHIDDLEKEPKDNKDTGENENKAKKDILMDETKEIMVDFISIASRKGYTW